MKLDDLPFGCKHVYVERATRDDTEWADLRMHSRKHGKDWNHGNYAKRLRLGQSEQCCTR